MDSIIKENSIKKSYFIICPFHIGDLLISGCLAHAFKNQGEGVINVNVIALQYLSKMNVKFEGVDDIIYINQDQMDEIRKYIIMSGLYKTEDYIYGHFTLNSQGHMIWSNELDFIQRYKHDVYNLPLDTAFKKPIFGRISEKDVSRLNNKYILDKEHTVVLTPYSYSAQMLNDKFWETIVSQLKEREIVKKY